MTGGALEPHTRSARAHEPHGGPRRAGNAVATVATGLLLATVLGIGCGLEPARAAVEKRARPDERFESRVRGLAQEKRQADHVARTLLDAGLFLPRMTLDGLLYSASYGVSVAENPAWIEAAQDFFQLTEHVGFFPWGDYSAESFPALGLKGFYRRRHFALAAGGGYSNDRFWTLSADATFQRAWDQRTLKVRLSGAINLEDDREFFGIGAHPRTDERSFFRDTATEDSGRYLQRHEKVELAVGLLGVSKLGLFFDSVYRRRRPSSPSEGTSSIDAVFDVARLPGASDRDERLYNEFALQYDSRRYTGVPSPGVRAGGYAGISHGLGHSKGRLLRSGGNLALYVPVIRRNRLLVFQGTVDAVENLTDEVPISFAEYPRHPAFRGVSSRKIFRTDEWVLVPSVEYSWPLTHNLDGRLFVDWLLVSPSLESLSIADTPWASGLALDIHTRHHAVGRLLVAGGTEGLRVSWSVFPGLGGNRSDWR